MIGNIENSPNALPAPLSVTLPDPNLLNDIAPWDLRFRQLEPGRMSVRVSIVEGENLSILGFQSNLKLHQIGAAPTGRVTLGIPASGGVPKWRGTPAETGSLISFGSGEEFDGISCGRFHGLTFSMSEKYFDMMCDRLGLPNEVRSRAFGVLDANTQSSQRGGVLRSAIDLLDGNGPPFSAEVEEDMMLALVLSAVEDDARLVDQTTPAVRAAARHRALEAMHELAHKAPRISEICIASGVGWRTLDRAFKEHFGIGPKAYLDILRLSIVRRELIRSGPELAVSRVADRMGFSHMSQFAKDYKLLFGELPTETRSHGARPNS